MTIAEPLGWAAALRPGTIVAFHFPLGEGETGSPKARPCLVIAVTDHHCAHLVTVAYGTSADTASNRGLDIDVSDPHHCRVSGLHRPTRFVLARRVTVAVTDASFALHWSGSPVIGVLPPQRMIDLHRHLQALGATITVDCRRGVLPTTRPPRRELQEGQGARRVPVIVRVTRRRTTRPAACAGSPNG